ncbi:MAG: 30S ribosomal protein S12 methylthiotransferase RimO [Deltaproteobacteria bacterium]|nr:30S ribosomal protein S12 methylthiotransferase RimO [Deltaproteobacteria bacterium]MBW2070133.1 30S ribosomal protein S12 methylthiotransferase RimO [Deltaproteobacteria bacterium]
MEPTTFYLQSLGCAKNRVDSELILASLTTAGYQLVADHLEAEVIVVNTCAFIESAVQESIDTILELAQAKNNGNCRMLVVTGCLPQRYGKKLARELPEVNLFLGTSTFHRLAPLLSRVDPEDPQKLLLEPPQFLMDSACRRQLSGPAYSSYLKIAEGCSNRCSFCTIPSIRGPYRSRSLDDLLQEAHWLAAQGVQEINLIAQDTTAYGKDLSSNICLADLLEALAQANLFPWIRLLYCHPQRITDRLLRVMCSHESICAYLDIPVQHASSRILTAMARPGTGEQYLALINRIRQSIPEVVIRTTVIVGFPSETEDDFRQLCSFVEKARFQYLGIFAFSPEKGTAAARMSARLETRTIDRRLQELAALQEQISKAYHQQLLGSVQQVLIEGVSPETDLLLQGRLRGQAPDVDGRILINRGTACLGKITPVRITEAHAYDLVGEIVA